MCERMLRCVILTHCALVPYLRAFHPSVLLGFALCGELWTGSHLFHARLHVYSVMQEKDLIYRFFLIKIVVFLT